jgi:hypothetical protein
MSHYREIADLELARAQAQDTDAFGNVVHLPVRKRQRVSILAPEPFDWRRLRRFAGEGAFYVLVAILVFEGARSYVVAAAKLIGDATQMTGWAG